jgi:hypothetical protein
LLISERSEKDKERKEGAEVVVGWSLAKLPLSRTLRALNLFHAFLLSFFFTFTSAPAFDSTIHKSAWRSSPS